MTCLPILYAEDAVERTLCQIRSVHVFKIPPRTSAGGYRASDWKDEVWQGAVKIVQKGLDAAIVLTDPKTGKDAVVCLSFRFCRCLIFLSASCVS